MRFCGRVLSCRCNVPRVWDAFGKTSGAAFVFVGDVLEIFVRAGKIRSDARFGPFSSLFAGLTRTFFLQEIS